MASTADRADFEAQMRHAQSVIRSLPGVAAPSPDATKLAEVTYDPDRGFRNWGDWNNASQWNDWGNFHNS